MKKFIFAILILAAWVVYTQLSGQINVGSNGGRSNMAEPGKTSVSPPVEPKPPIPPPANAPRIWPPPPAEKLEMAPNLTASNYLIIFDGSGSMSDSQCSGSLRKIDAAKKAVKEFVNSLDKDSNAGLVAFGATPTGRFFEQGFVSSGKQVIGQALDRVEAGGKTPLQEAIRRGYALLLKQAQRQGGYGQYHMVIITDGISTDGEPGDVAINIARESAIQIHAIGFCLQGGHSLNDPRFARYSTANDPQALAAGLAGVLAESEQFDPGSFVSQ